MADGNEGAAAAGFARHPKARSKRSAFIGLAALCVTALAGCHDGHDRDDCGDMRDDGCRSSGGGGSGFVGGGGGSGGHASPVPYVVTPSSPAAVQGPVTTSSPSGAASEGEGAVTRGGFGEAAAAHAGGEGGHGGAGE